MGNNWITTRLNKKRRKTAVLGVCALIAGVICAGISAKAHSQEPTVGDLYRAFVTVVFGREFADDKSHRHVLKWEKPLRVAIRAYDDVLTDHGNGVTEISFSQIPVKDEYFDLTRRHLATLSTLTNLTLESYQGTDHEPNLTINFVRRVHMTEPELVNNENINTRQLASQNGCYFVIWRDPKTRAIDRVVIVVNIDRDASSLSHCILEELIQSSGLPNDNNVSWPSIFSNNQRLTTLSRSDKILVKTLYDPTITSGMDKKSTMRRALKLISALHSE